MRPAEASLAPNTNQVPLQTVSSIPGEDFATEQTEMESTLPKDTQQVSGEPLSGIPFCALHCPKTHYGL